MGDTKPLEAIEAAWENTVHVIQEVGNLLSGKTTAELKAMKKRLDACEGEIENTTHEFQANSTYTNAIVEALGEVIEREVNHSTIHPVIQRVYSKINKEFPTLPENAEEDAARNVLRRLTNVEEGLVSLKGEMDDLDTIADETEKLRKEDKPREAEKLREEEEKEAEKEAEKLRKPEKLRKEEEKEAEGRDIDEAQVKMVAWLVEDAENQRGVVQNDSICLVQDKNVENQRGVVQNDSLRLVQDEHVKNLALVTPTLDAKDALIRFFNARVRKISNMRPVITFQTIVSIAMLFFTMLVLASTRSPSVIAGIN
jgi:preprotein translocase subunit SecD